MSPPCSRLRLCWSSFTIASALAIAVARPHQLIWTGDSVTLDATKSWAASGEIAKYEWQFGDGSAAAGAKVERTYDTPGRHSEILKITTSDGDVAYDFAVVIVYDRENPDRHINTIHANYAPSFGIRAGDPVTFKVRSFIPSEPRNVKETWDFGDGSPLVEVQSDGNAKKLAPDGYAETTHAFEKAGDYIVKVERTNEHGVKSTGHVWVHIENGASNQRLELAYFHHLQLLNRAPAFRTQLPHDMGGISARVAAKSGN